MRRHLLAVVAIVGAVVAFYVIAPAPGTSGFEREGIFARDRDVAAARANVYALGDTLRAVNAALLRARAWERARAVAPDPALTKVITVAGIAPLTARSFEDAARAEFAALEAPRVPLRVLLVPDSQLTNDYRKQTVIPQTAEQPCVVLVSISPRARNLRVGTGDRLLGACGFYAKFGRPGQGMQSWLETTRGVGASVDTVLFEPRRPDRRNKLQGSEIGMAPADAACLAGDDDGCAQSVLDPYGFWLAQPILPPNERTAAVLISFSSSGRYGPGRLLARLREHVGDAAFQKIWVSAEPLSDAYKTTTGEHIAVFARPILLSQTLPHTPGPLRGGLPLLLGLGIGVTAAVWAIKRTRRERSGT